MTPEPVAVILAGGTPGYRLTEPAAPNLPWQARIRIGAAVIETEDSAWLRTLAQACLEAADERDNRDRADEAARLPNRTTYPDLAPERLAAVAAQDVPRPVHNPPDAGPGHPGDQEAGHAD